MNTEENGVRTPEEDNAEAITIKVQLNAKDRERAMNYNYFGRRKFILADIIFFVLLAIVLAALHFASVITLPKYVVVACIGFVAFMAMFLVLIKLMSGAGSAGTRVVTFTPSELSTHMASEKKVHTIKWQDFEHSGITKNYYFLYIERTQFLIIPKRYLSAEEQEKITKWIGR